MIVLRIFFLLLVSPLLLYPVLETEVALAGDDLKKFTFGDKQKFKVGFRDGEIIVRIQPRPGEGLFRFASWTLKDWNNNYKKIQKFNNNRPLQKGVFVTFPFSELNANMQSLALQTLFEHDSSEEEGWAHRVLFEGETISLISGVFAKNEISAAKLIEYNKLKNNGKNLGIGDVVMIPWDWVREELNLKPVEVKEPLFVKVDQFGKPYAWYKIKKGESLYSSVVIRFTGRTLAEDVNEMAKQLLKLNNIDDERFIMAGSEIKIPLEWISEEYIRKKIAEPLEKEPEEEVVKKPVKKGEAIHVIIDPGHGGVDPGATFGSIAKGDRIYEDETVYDIGLRLAKILKSSNFKIYITLVDPDQEKPIVTLAQKKDSDERVNVNPAYLIRSANVGINMRIFLINNIYNRLLKEKVPKENIILLSLHADALHKSLRGVSVYFPDARLRSHNFKLRHSIYRRRNEYAREIRFTGGENKFAAKASSAFGHNIVQTFKKSGLKAHTSFPVRGYYYRKGKRTLPGILRYSKIPASVLVEVGNLGNDEDRALFGNADFRQKVATALAESIQSHYI